MNLFQVFLLVVALLGFGYGGYCQAKARKCISKDKIQQLEDTSIIANGPMPPKEILNEEGLRYYKGFCIGSGIFIGCLILLVIVSKL